MVARRAHNETTPGEKFLIAQHNNSYPAGWSSSVARRAHNPKVVGSNPAPATIKQLQKPIYRF